MHVVFGEIGAAVEDLALVGEEGGEGPAALSRDGADSALVAAVNLGPFVPVDLNGDEAVVDNGGNFGVFVTLAVHDVAPMAPYCSDVEEYGLVLSGGELKGLVAPRVPVDGLVGGAFEIGAGFVGEAVGASGLLGIVRLGHEGAFSSTGEGERRPPGKPDVVGLPMIITLGIFRFLC